MKIPDDVFEKRCKYCIHYTGGENADVPASRMFKTKDHACHIFGISQCDQIPGECKSFHPNHIFGICYTCQFNNSFHEGFCTRNEQPNKRQIYVGFGGLNREYFGTHCLSTCEAYRPNAYWLDIMQKQAAEGKIPRNFDPETFKPTENTPENEVARKWAEIEREQAQKKIEARIPEAGEISIFDLIGETK